MLRALDILGQVEADRSSSSASTSSLLSAPLSSPGPSAQSRYHLRHRSTISTRVTGLQRPSAVRPAKESGPADDPHNAITPPLTPEKRGSPRTPIAKRKRNLPLTPESLPRLLPIVEIPIRAKRPKPSLLTHSDSPSKTSSQTGSGVLVKIHLIQETVRHDPWRMLVATSLLNVTSGRAARPVYHEIVRRWPSPHALVNGTFPCNPSSSNRFTRVGYFWKS